MSDQTIFDRINELSHEEEALWRRAGEAARLARNRSTNAVEGSVSPGGTVS